MLEFAFRVTQQEDMTMAIKHADKIRVGKYINIFSKRALFVPCHVPGHWVLLVVYPQEKKILYVDSIYSVENAKM